MKRTSHLPQSVEAAPVAAPSRFAVTRQRLTSLVFMIAVFALAAVAAMAQTGTGTQTYGLGQGGSPAGSDYFSAAQGFNASLSPLLTAILPVLVVILAIWQGPKLLKHLVTMMAH